MGRLCLNQHRGVVSDLYGRNFMKLSSMKWYFKYASCPFFVIEIFMLFMLSTNQ